MSYEMYEDFKETMVKTIKTELAAKTANNNQSSDNDLSYQIQAANFGSENTIFKLEKPIC